MYERSEKIVNLKVSIVILNWNGWRDTVECLESVLRNNYANYQVIVIDNDSQDGSLGYIKAWAEGKLNVWVNPDNPLRNLSYPPVWKPVPYIYYTKDEAEKGGKPKKEEQSKEAVISNNTITTQYPLVFIQTESNLGFAGGNNVGIKYAIRCDADYILLLNNDTVVERSFLSELVHTGKQVDKVAVLGSVIADYQTGLTVFTNSKIDRKLKAEIRQDYLNSDKQWWKTEMANGACMMISSRHILKHSLLLWEDLFLYGEEADLSMRAAKQGLETVMSGNSKVYHKGGASTGGSLAPKGIYYSLRNRIFMAKKLLNLKDKIIFWLLFVNARLCRTLEWLVKGKWKLVRATFCSFRDGLKGKTGKL
ncbi:MAG: glycosyltransferase family 2 protein [Sedimentisphaerales bacterium]|nr:glycosyltransferase family 2 protein [Sedimentisphaerales bacterium]